LKNIVSLHQQICYVFKFKGMYKANSQILFQKLGNEAVILHLQSEEYFGLDEVGTRIWEVLTEAGSIEKAIPLLLQEFEVEAATLEADVKELVDELQKAQILENV
jgi:hypothetical protein